MIRKEVSVYHHLFISKVVYWCWIVSIYWCLWRIVYRRVRSVLYWCASSRVRWCIRLSGFLVHQAVCCWKLCEISGRWDAVMWYCCWRLVFWLCCPFSIIAATTDSHQLSPDPESISSTLSPSKFRSSDKFICQRSWEKSRSGTLRSLNWEMRRCKRSALWVLTLWSHIPNQNTIVYGCGICVGGKFLCEFWGLGLQADAETWDQPHSHSSANSTGEFKCYCSFAHMIWSYKHFCSRDIVIRSALCFLLDSLHFIKLLDFANFTVSRSFLNQEALKKQSARHGLYDLMFLLTAQLPCLSITNLWTPWGWVQSLAQLTILRCFIDAAMGSNTTRQSQNVTASWCFDQDAYWEIHRHSKLLLGIISRHGQESVTGQEVPYSSDLQEQWGGLASHDSSNLAYNISPTRGKRICLCLWERQHGSDRYLLDFFFCNLKLAPS